MSVELITTPNPILYTGFVPQYKDRIGDTYGTTSHKLLLDPTVSHAEKLILADIKVDNSRVVRPSQKDINIVLARALQGDPVYTHPMVPGYEGFVPRVSGMTGQRFAVQATEGISEFEQLQKRDFAAFHQLEKQGLIQDDKWNPKTLADRQLTTTGFKLPLLKVRPECAGILRNLPIEKEPIKPPSVSSSPYFMDNNNPEKYLKTGKLLFLNILGFTGPVPFGYSTFGMTNKEMTNKALCDFTSNYRKRLSSEWSPVLITRPDPRISNPPAEIYLRDRGLMSNYTGHVPGAIFRFGNTYGNDSRDAKRWLRGDYS
ncbi:hypothetical protein FQR65_LT10426 [Abscondita terminalis]|nr:hypothetical protein FQR65_LT10426 [Abscondita terminalis]